MMNATVRGDPSPETPVAVKMTWALVDWRRLAGQLKEFPTQTYELRQLRKVIEAAVSEMDCHYNIDVQVT